MSGTLPEEIYAELDRRLTPVDALRLTRYPGEWPARQPVHTCYVPADRYSADTIAEWGAAAQLVLAATADHPGLADALGLTPDLLAAVLPRVQAKLDAEPVEDLRIDFEDGYGKRTDAEEDAAAAAAGAALAATRARTPSAGLRIRSLEAPTRTRAVRTLATFLATFTAAGGDAAGLIVTLPKVSHPDQVRALVLACARLESVHGLAGGAVRCELQVELPEAVLGTDGAAMAGRLIDAAAGRCDGLHYGTYDYSAALGIDPAEPVVTVTEGPLTGKTLVVTGTLTAPRADIQRRIEEAGGKVAGSVSKKTSYLVAGADTGKTKLEAAAKHGVTVIDEAELEKLLTGS